MSINQAFNQLSKPSPRQQMQQNQIDRARKKGGEQFANNLVTKKEKIHGANSVYTPLQKLDQRRQELAKNKAVSSLKSLGEKEALKNDVGAYMARAGEHHQRSLRNQSKVETLRKINELGKYNSLSSEAEYDKIYKALEENNPGPGPKPAALNFFSGSGAGL